MIRGSIPKTKGTTTALSHKEYINCVHPSSICDASAFIIQWIPPPAANTDKPQQMRTSSLLTLVPLVASLAHAGVAEDRLVSRRLGKRGLDANGNYNISIYHLNDVHAHLDQFLSSGTDCTDPTRGCYGGYARVKSVIDKDRPTKEDSLFLNAGDEFQGTLFYTFYGGEKIAETLNQLGFDAMTVGNQYVCIFF